ncbi:hypothetical protein B0H21DRAFT_739342 [Amylocystis lapponica]|nr:hypothetical protein B0H21DRAFT_739342 [Amylocystis lapponica]
MTTILHFLGAVTYPLLTSLEMGDFEHVQKWTEFVPHLRAFSTMFAHYQALRTLRIVCRIDNYSDNFWLVELVAPLLELHQLEEVMILTYSERMSLDDDGLCKLASSWPNLISLTLDSDIFVYPAKDVPYMALHAIAAFARFCSNLHSLELPAITVPSNINPSQRCPTACGTCVLGSAACPRTATSSRGPSRRRVSVGRR